MALLTALPIDAARALSARYGLLLAGVDALEAGSVNSNFRVHAQDGRKFFLRIYEEQDRAGAEREVRLLQRLAESGVPTAAPIRRPDGEWLTDYAGKPAALFEWVEGEILCQRQVTPERCAAIGQALAAVHRTEFEHLDAGRFNVDALERRLDFIEQSASAELVEAARDIRRWLRGYAMRRNPALPAGVIHGDLFRDNVLWQGPSVRALLDFESASRGPFAFDLMVTIHAWCYGDSFDPALVLSLLSAYHEQRPLETAEFAALPVEAGIAALRFATTRITDFSMRAEPGAPPARDYRRFLDRVAAIERGALRSAIAAVQRGG
jgi:homoserine kinase type II